MSGDGLGQRCPKCDRPMVQMSRTAASCPHVERWKCEWCRYSCEVPKLASVMDGALRGAGDYGDPFPNI